tara:strand:+ start:445 stop:1137 length:693 start_codon:yes stop_codon:yes gene_type:complete
MKVVILAGGFGTRISEETHKIPKPMVKIGNKPIIDHIVNYYQKYKFKEIIICAGYKKEILQKYFIKKKFIKVIDTGLKTQTAARIKKIKKYLGNDKNFCMTYGDGLSNINLKKLVKFHLKHKKIGTLCAVRPIPRFGHLTLAKNKVKIFKEKDSLSEGWINGGFFVLNTKIFDYISSKQDCIFEKEPLENLSKDGELMAFKHENFWHPVDTLRDKNYLNKLVKNNQAPWL